MKKKSQPCFCKSLGGKLLPWILSALLVCSLCGSSVFAMDGGEAGITPDPPTDIGNSTPNPEPQPEPEPPAESSSTLSSTPSNPNSSESSSSSGGNSSASSSSSGNESGGSSQTSSGSDWNSESSSSSSSSRPNGDGNTSSSKTSYPDPDPTRVMWSISHQKTTEMTTMATPPAHKTRWPSPHRMITRKFSPPKIGMSC